MRPATRWGGAREGAQDEGTADVPPGSKSPGRCRRFRGTDVGREAANISRNALVGRARRFRGTDVGWEAANVSRNALVGRARRFRGTDVGWEAANVSRN